MAKYEALENVKGERGVTISKGDVVNVNEIPNGELGKFKILGFENVEQRTAEPEIEIEKPKGRGKKLVVNPKKDEPAKPAEQPNEQKDEPAETLEDEEQKAETDLFGNNDGTVQRPWES